MPKMSTIAKAMQAKKEGKAPSTQASEFVREEMEKLKHKPKDDKSAPQTPKQAVAIGLSMARRSGVALPAKNATKSRKTAGTTSQTKHKSKKGASAGRKKKNS